MSGCWSDIPRYPCSGQPRRECPPLWPSAGLPSRIYFYREHPIHILPAKVYIKVELGCTYNGGWSKLYPSYSTPPHLLTVWETNSTGFKGAASLWHERGSHAMPLSATDFVQWQWGGAQHEKKKFVPSVIVSSNKHQPGQLLCVTIQVNSFLGKCFFLSLPRRRDGVPLFPRPNGISRASATPAVTVLSTSHLSSGPLMWLTRSLWSKWFWNGGWAGWEGGQHLLGMFLLMPDSRSPAPLTGRKDQGQRSVRVRRRVQVAKERTESFRHIMLS